MQRHLALALGVGFLALLTAGCGQNHMRIQIDNQTDNDLRNLVCSANGKSFELAMLASGTSKGLMTAERLFGNKLPEQMTLSFETEDGEKYSREVKFAAGSRGRTLRLVIDSELEVTGKRE